MDFEEGQSLSLKRKQEEDRVYIMNRIRSLQIEKQKDNNQLITSFPF